MFILSPGPRSQRGVGIFGRMTSTLGLATPAPLPSRSSRSVTTEPTPTNTPNGSQSDPAFSAGRTTTGHSTVLRGTNCYPVGGLTATPSGGFGFGSFVTDRDDREDSRAGVGAREIKTSTCNASTAARRAATLVSAASTPPVPSVGWFRVGPRTGTPGAVPRLGAVVLDLVEDDLADEAGRGEAGDAGGGGEFVAFGPGEPGGDYDVQLAGLGPCHRAGLPRVSAARADGRVGGAR